MKFDKLDFEQAVALLEEAEALRPIVRLFLDALKSYGSEIREIPEAMSDWLVKRTIKHVKTFEDAGFTRDEAILLTIDLKYSLREALNRTNKATKK